MTDTRRLQRTLFRMQLDPAFAGMLRATDLKTAVDGRRDSASWPSGGSGYWV